MARPACSGYKQAGRLASRRWSAVRHGQRGQQSRHDARPCCGRGGRRRVRRHLGPGDGFGYRPACAVHPGLALAPQAPRPARVYNKPTWWSCLGRLWLGSVQSLSLDSDSAQIEAPSPNFDARLSPPDMVVIHYTGMQSGTAALARLRDPDAQVSAHYLIERDGRVFRLVAEERRAWHAGVSFWKGDRDVNARSLGVELANPGEEHGYLPFPEAQVEALLALLERMRQRWTIHDRDIVGHSDVAPSRKVDPGPLFPWKRLAEAGHGLWAEPPAAPGASLCEGDAGQGVFLLQAGLTRLGYDCAPSGAFDGATRTIVEAFQRHWRPERIDGVMDGESRARLMALLRKQAR